MKWHELKFMANSLLVLLLGVGLAGCEKSSSDNEQTVRYVHPAEATLPKEMFVIGGEPFEIELAYTHQARQKGLMFRKSVGQNEGMFFVFHRPRIQSFYMKNCLVDLDIVFIKESGEIDRIDRMTVPVAGKTLKNYFSRSAVRFVLELKAGSCERLGLKEGQILELPQRVFRIISDRD